MKRHLSLDEQETIICISASKKKCVIDTCIPSTIRHLDRLCREKPNDYKMISEERYEDGMVLSRQYETDRKNIKYFKPRDYTEEEREELRRRGKELYERQKALKNNTI